MPCPLPLCNESVTRSDTSPGCRREAVMPTAVSLLLPVAITEETIPQVLKPFEVEYSDRWGRGTWCVFVAPRDERDVHVTDDSEDLEAMPASLLHPVTDILGSPPMAIVTLIFEP